MWARIRHACTFHASPFLASVATTARDFTGLAHVSLTVLVSTFILAFTILIVVFHLHLVRWPIATLGLTVDDFANVDVYSYDPRDQSVGVAGVYVGSSAIIITLLFEFLSLSLPDFQVLTDLVSTCMMLGFWISVNVCWEVQAVVFLILVLLILEFFYFCTLFALACLGHLRGVPRAFLQPVVDGFWRVHPSKKRRAPSSTVANCACSITDTASVYSAGEPIRITFNTLSSMSQGAHLTNDYELKAAHLQPHPQKTFVLGNEDDVCLVDTKGDIKAKSLV
ncbi:hypothetical protein PIIN_11793 [Serendipita indica DSM 11827]|uniref:Uncharacterized protein n=1 Tax=Serendipita indica (strain DSM 11827) TaxID=1109443 RepID=G4TR30_SERID|nr:hypothetical protein PIIN_11793 [Serendipita indica DSM 11827]